MKIKSAKFISAILIIPLLSACSPKKETPNIPQYNVDFQGTTSEFSKAAEVKKENGFYPEETEQPFDFPDNDSSFTGFDGLGTISATPVLGNDQQNLTSDPAYCGIVCGKDGAVYYTALGYDNFLHKKENGVDEVFLEKTVWGINIIGGQMYCIMNSETPVQNLPPFSHGDIYKVDLKTGEMTLILATRACSLAALKDKLCFIYWNDLDSTVYNRVYECDLSGNNIKSKNAAFLGFVGEYTLGYDKFGQNSILINETGEEKLRYTDRNNIYSFTSEGEYFYYKPSGSSLYRVNIENGEKKAMMPAAKYRKVKIDYSETESEVINADTYIGGYRICDEAAYIVFDRIAFKVLPNETSEVYMTPITASDDRYYEGLFSDGEMFYTVKSNYTKQQYKLIGIDFTDEKAAPGIKTVKEINLL